MNTPPPLYPLTFEPIYKEKVWGGRALEKLGRGLPGDASVGIGESWEIADLATTSASGGGGNAEHSVVANGPLAGQTIRQLMDTYGEQLLGPGIARSADGGFPLLIKFLDARENLSVQVHPSPEYAAAHPDAHLKSEAWYVVDAEPGAVIYKGLAPGTTPEQLRAAIEANTDDAVVPLLNAIEVKPGDCHYLPSGTLHALGAGVLVAEVQTPSDTTFRVFDWGRTDRELHVEQAMACIDFANETQSAGDAAEALMGMTSRSLVSSEHFRIRESISDASIQFECAQNGLEILVPLQGDMCIVLLDSEERIPLDVGQTVLCPEAMKRYYLFWAMPGSRWLEIRIPSAAR